MELTRSQKLAKELYDSELTEDILEELINDYGVDKETNKCRECYKLTCDAGESESLVECSCLFETPLDIEGVSCTAKMGKWLNAINDDKEESLCY